MIPAVHPYGRRRTVPELSVLGGLGAFPGRGRHPRESGLTLPEAGRPAHDRGRSAIVARGGECLRHRHRPGIEGLADDAAGSPGRGHPPNVGGGRHAPRGDDG
jgi:hypothetical protein